MVSSKPNRNNAEAVTVVVAGYTSSVKICFTKQGALVDFDLDVSAN
jgi:hypothetical protein